MSLAYRSFATPFGTMFVFVNEAGALVKLAFPDDPPAGDTIRDDARCEPVVQQVLEYFDGARQNFEIKLAPDGTPFQKLVWAELVRIPFGTTVSYGEIARRIGRPSASRAVGRANGSNPIPIVVPCHRVIGSSGTLTGYAGGLDIKRGLLHLEGYETVEESRKQRREALEPMLF